MNGYHQISADFSVFAQHLRSEEREASTIKKYLRDVRSFLVWADERAVNKGNTAQITIKIKWPGKGGQP